MKTITSWQDLLHPGDATDFFSRRVFQPFDPDAHAYAPGNALWLAELSRLVYRHDTEEKGSPPQPTRTSFVENAGFKQRQFFLSRATDTQAMLVEFGGAAPFAVLVFRGTEQAPKDFITDLETGAPPLDQNKINAHDGFEEALDSVWGEIEDALAQITCPLFYTGHSLGAALATLAAARCAPTAVYTFGSPRVGNRAFCDTLANVPIYRVVDDEDVVTTLPPEELGFHHVGTEQRLIGPRSKSIFGWIKNLCSPPKPLADHAPVNYVDRV